MHKLTEHVGGGWSCPTNKRPFDTRGKAKAWIKANRDAWGAGDRRRVYRCIDCPNFHVTSYTAEETREIREKRARGEL